MGRASCFLMSLRGPCLEEGKGAMPRKGSLSLSALLRSFGTKRGQGPRTPVHKHQASVVHVHGAPWLKKQKEAWLHREESEFGEALTESHSFAGALGAPCCALVRKAKAKCRLEPSPPGSSWRRLHLLPGHLEQGVCLTWVEGLSSWRGLDPSTRGRL